MWNTSADTASGYVFFRTLEKLIRSERRSSFRRSGLFAYLGTDDGKEIERRAKLGEKKYLEVYQAMAYQISKEIGSMATVLEGRVDAILLTGGLPHPPLSDWIIERTGWIAPVRIYAGEREMEALAQAAARFLFGEEDLKSY